MPSFPLLQAKYGRVSNRSMTVSGALDKERYHFSVLGQVALVRLAVSCPLWKEHLPPRRDADLLVQTQLASRYIAISRS